MFLKKLIASARMFWSRSRTRDDGEHGRIIGERLLEMSKRPPVGTASRTDEGDEQGERKERERVC